MKIIKEAEADLEFAKEFIFNGKNGPVVALNGIGGGWVKKGFRKFMAENNVAGHLIYRDLRNGGLESYVPSVKEVIDEYTNPTLVGFSAGGLVMAECVEKYNLWDKINKLITIATPFEGIDTPLLTLFGESIKDIQMGSKFITEMQKLNPSKDKIISIFAKYDKFIPNPEKIKLPWKTIVTDAEAHGQIQGEKKWYENILLESLNSR